MSPTNLDKIDYKQHVICNRDLVIPPISVYIHVYGFINDIIPQMRHKISSATYR